MTLDDLLKIDFTGKDILIIGRCGAGKTWLSELLVGMYKHHTVIHTDSYLTSTFGEQRQVQALIEDADFNKPTIIEGILSYPLLLTGARDQSYFPDCVIEVEISAGKQREIYLQQRGPSKIQYLKRFAIKMQEILNEYHRIAPKENKPLWIKFENNYATKVKDK
jgi:hypothetical protein